ncbi:MAG: glycosyltransferase family 39 protein [Tildeniella nuda ZEHNDER 1965/U140]|jgi:hypothetical protein|nr:glycosyltransferase family 39 protein [Tildeniella nuda ZEHNDER 1965/U140]
MKQATLSWKRSSQFAKTDSANVLLIILVWIVMSILVNPLGDFPINDDWVYGRAVKSIIEEGNFTLSGGNTSANLVAQAFWGALFCLPFGFSFSALRISTLVLGLIGVIATYGLLREVRASRLISLFGALLVALNPIYFGLSNTFMTDVPFFAVAAMSLYFFIRGLRSDRKVDITLGTLLACLSLLIRQNGIIIPIAFGCAYLFKKKLSRTNVIVASIPTLSSILLQFIYQNWLELTDRTSPNFNLQSRGFVNIISSANIGTIVYLLDSTLIALVYVGLFISPLIIPIFLTKFRASSSTEKRLIFLSIPSILIVMLARLAKNRPMIMPFKGNTLMDFGLGPLTLHDGDAVISSRAFTPAILTYVWGALTVVAVISAAFLIYYLLTATRHIFKQPKKDESVSPQWLKVLVVLTILFYYLPFGISTYFDRYLLMLIPLLLMLVVGSKPMIDQPHFIHKKIFPVALLIILICGGFTVGATHDYLSLNRVRWQALNALMRDSKVSPNYIDGGYEFNGWYLYDPKNTYAINFMKDPKRPDKSWWYVDRDDYMIAFGNLAGYEELKRYQTGRWLPFGPETISVLRKESA